MPVRPKRNKRRADELEAWWEVFETGVDWDQQLPAIGVATDHYDFLLDEEDAREPWYRLGAQFLADWHDAHFKPWALEQFGEPPCP